MDDPASLSRALIDAFNRRDAAAIAAMTAPTVDYLRAGGTPITTPAGVQERYEADFRTTPDIHAEMVEVAAQTDTDVAFELVITVAGLTLSGAAHHRWIDGKLVRYRAWTEPLPRSG